MRWLDEEMQEVEESRSEMEWVWSDTGQDYWGDRYQAAQERYLLACRNYNRQVHRPYIRGTKPLLRINT